MACSAFAVSLVYLQIDHSILALDANITPVLVRASSGGLDDGVNVLQWLLIAFGGYALVGMGVAVWFVGWGAARRDPLARLAPLRVRVLFGPGAMAVWPVLLAGRSRRGGANQTEG